MSTLPWFSNKTEIKIFEDLGYAAVFAAGPLGGTPVRIGWGVRIPAKLSELQAGNPQDLFVHALVWTLDFGMAKRLEDAVHALVEPYRIRGHWFDRSGDQVKECFYDAARERRIPVTSHDDMMRFVRDQREGRLRRRIGVA